MSSDEVVGDQARRRAQCEFAIKLLKEHATYLNAIRWRGWRTTISYELLSGALIWSDEIREGMPRDLINALKILFAFRTSLMLGKPREEFRPAWDASLQLFSKWIGFRPERRAQTEKLLEIYRRGDVGHRKCLRDMEREWKAAEN